MPLQVTTVQVVVMEESLPEIGANGGLLGAKVKPGYS